jgi:hypothetical protein
MRRLLGRRIILTSTKFLFELLPKTIHQTMESIELPPVLIVPPPRKVVGAEAESLGSARITVRWGLLYPSRQNRIGRDMRKTSIRPGLNGHAKCV